MKVSKYLPDIQLLINMFEDQGFGVMLQHTRTDAPYRKDNGITVIKLTRNSGNTIISSGTAVCSLSDNFNKAIGTHIAFYRLMKNIIDAYVF